jgi:hypothetical protein
MGAQELQTIKRLQASQMIEQAKSVGNIERSIIEELENNPECVHGGKASIDALSKSLGLQWKTVRDALERIRKSINEGGGPL